MGRYAVGSKGDWQRVADARSISGSDGTDVPMCSGFPRPLAEMGRCVASNRAESRVSSPSEALAFAKPQVRDSRAKSTREAPTIVCYTTRDSCQRTAKYTAERAICAAVARMPAAGAGAGAGMSLSEGGGQDERGGKRGRNEPGRRRPSRAHRKAGAGRACRKAGAKMDASGNEAETGTSTSQTPRLAQASPAPPEHEKSRGRFRSRL
jgi:hypothetical protein